MREGVFFSSSGRAMDRYGDYVKQAMRKNCLPKDRLLWEDNFFALLVLSSRRSGGSSFGFRAGSL